MSGTHISPQVLLKTGLSFIARSGRDGSYLREVYAVLSLLDDAALRAFIWRGITKQKDYHFYVVEGGEVEEVVGKRKRKVQQRRQLDHAHLEQLDPSTDSGYAHVENVIVVASEAHRMRALGIMGMKDLPEDADSLDLVEIIGRSGQQGIPQSDIDAEMKRWGVPSGMSLLVDKLAAYGVIKKQSRVEKETAGRRGSLQSVSRLARYYVHEPRNLPQRFISKDRVIDHVRSFLSSEAGRQMAQIVLEHFAPRKSSVSVPLAEAARVLRIDGPTVQALIRATQLVIFSRDRMMLVGRQNEEGLWELCAKRASATGATSPFAVKSEGLADGEGVEEDGGKAEDVRGSEHMVELDPLRQAYRLMMIRPGEGFANPDLVHLLGMPTKKASKVISLCMQNPQYGAQVGKTVIARTAGYRIFQPLPQSGEAPPPGPLSGSVLLKVCDDLSREPVHKRKGQELRRQAKSKGEEAQRAAVEEPASGHDLTSGSVKEDEATASSSSTAAPQLVSLDHRGRKRQRVEAADAADSHAHPDQPPVYDSRTLDGAMPVEEEEVVSRTTAGAKNAAGGDEALTAQAWWTRLLSATRAKRFEVAHQALMAEGIVTVGMLLTRIKEAERGEAAQTCDRRSVHRVLLHMQNEGLCRLIAVQKGGQKYTYVVAVRSDIGLQGPELQSFLEDFVTPEADFHKTHVRVLYNCTSSRYARARQTAQRADVSTISEARKQLKVLTGTMQQVQAFHEVLWRHALPATRTLSREAADGVPLSMTEVFKSMLAGTYVRIFGLDAFMWTDEHLEELKELVTRRTLIADLPENLREPFFDRQRVMIAWKTRLKDLVAHLEALGLLREKNPRKTEMPTWSVLTAESFDRSCNVLVGGAKGQEGDGEGVAEQKGGEADAKGEEAELGGNLEDQTGPHLPWECPLGDYILAAQASIPVTGVIDVSAFTFDLWPDLTGSDRFSGIREYWGTLRTLALGHRSSSQGEKVDGEGGEVSGVDNEGAAVSQQLDDEDVLEMPQKLSPSLMETMPHLSRRVEWEGRRSRKPPQKKAGKTKERSKPGPKKGSSRTTQKRKRLVEGEDEHEEEEEGVEVEQKPKKTRRKSKRDEAEALEALEDVEQKELGGLQLSLVDEAFDEVLIEAFVRQRAAWGYGVRQVPPFLLSAEELAAQATAQAAAAKNKGDGEEEEEQQQPQDQKGEAEPGLGAIGNRGRKFTMHWEPVMRETRRERMACCRRLKVLLNNPDLNSRILARLKAASEGHDTLTTVKPTERLERYLRVVDPEPLFPAVLVKVKQVLMQGDTQSDLKRQALLGASIESVRKAYRVMWDDGWLQEAAQASRLAEFLEDEDDVAQVGAERGESKAGEGGHEGAGEGEKGDADATRPVRKRTRSAHHTSKRLCFSRRYEDSLLRGSATYSSDFHETLARSPHMDDPPELWPSGALCRLVEAFWSRLPLLEVTVDPLPEGTAPVDRQSFIDQSFNHINVSLIKPEDWPTAHTQPVPILQLSLDVLLYGDVRRQPQLTPAPPGYSVVTQAVKRPGEVGATLPELCDDEAVGRALGAEPKLKEAVLQCLDAAMDEGDVIRVPGFFEARFVGREWSTPWTMTNLPPRVDGGQELTSGVSEPEVSRPRLALPWLRLQDGQLHGKFLIRCLRSLTTAVHSKPGLLLSDLQANYLPFLSFTEVALLVHALAVGGIIRVVVICVERPSSLFSRRSVRVVDVDPGKVSRAVDGLANDDKVSLLPLPDTMTRFSALEDALSSGVSNKQRGASAAVDGDVSANV